MPENFEQEQMEERDIIEEFSSQEKRRPFWRRFIFGGWILILMGLLVGVGGMLIYKTGFTFNQMQAGGNDLNSLISGESMATPPPDSGRLNVLLLGLRGEDDPNGGLLTDTMMILSLKKSTGQAALISIPRDLSVTMPGQNYKEKINFAYALGFEKRGVAGALLYSKIAASQATGLHISRAIAVNHAAFKETVDILGGVDIYLDKPFAEKSQFAQEMIIDLPAGENHLNGNQALYFVRSRFSTSDFDRARRQQMVLAAVKDKALSLGVLSNPLKIYKILEALGRNVKTDMPWDETKELIALAVNFDSHKIIHRVFDTMPDGLLEASHTANGIYILLPAGDDFSKIREACKNIFDSSRQ